MNIAFVNSTRKWGGVKTWTLESAAFLKEQGHGVHVIARPGPFADQASESGLSVWTMRFGIDFSPLRIIQCARFFQRNAIDLLVANVGKDMRIAGVAAKLAGVPVVHRVGLAGDLRNRPKIRWLHQWIKPHLLVPCEFIKQGLLENLPYLHAHEIEVIRTGKEPAKEPPARVHSPRRLITTSQLNPDKGHADLLNALAACREAGHAYHLEIVGTGRDEARLKELAQEQGLADCVIFSGFVDNVRERLRQADIFLLPSLSEGLPNSLLEAMAQGLVPVARNVGGVAEVWPETMKDFLLKPEPGPDKLETALSMVLKAEDSTLAAWQRVAWDTARSAFHHMVQQQSLETFFLERVQRSPKRSRQEASA